MAQRKCKQDVRDEMLRGRLAFHALCEERPITPNAIEIMKRFRLRSQKSTLEGIQWQRLSHLHGLDPSKPIFYRGLSFRTLEVEKTAIKLDRPLIVNPDANEVTQVFEVVGSSNEPLLRNSVSNGFSTGCYHTNKRELGTATVRRKETQLRCGAAPCERTLLTGLGFPRPSEMKFPLTKKSTEL